MTTTFALSNFQTQDPAEFIYTLSAAYLDYTSQINDKEMTCLNDEQHTLVAYAYLDSQIQEGGFVQLIAEGYGEYIFMNPVADSLRQWRIKPTPKILDKAKALYFKYGEEIETLAEQETPIDEIRAQFSDFEELDGEYYEIVDEDMALAASYIEAHPDKFMHIEKHKI